MAGGQRVEALLRRRFSLDLATRGG